MFRVIKGEKIKAARGERSLQHIVDLADGRFTRAALSHWENNLFSPRDENVVPLLRALGCTYEDISEPYGMEVAA